MSKYTSFILPYQELDVNTEKEKTGPVCLLLSEESRHKCLRKEGPAGMWFLHLKTDRGREDLTIMDCQRKQSKTMLNFSPGSDIK